MLFSVSISSQTVAQDVEFFDGTFNLSQWEANEYYADDGARLASTAQSGTGNPGSNLEMTFRWNEGIEGARAVFVFFKNLNATYDPSVQGAIASIDVSEDGRVVSDSHGAASITLPMRLALEQDGNIYSNMIDLAVVQNEPFPAEWVTVSESGQVAANFPIRHGSGPARPDFSETGSEIHFGFVRANSTTVRLREITTAIDNWHVTIHPVGEPGTAELAVEKTADVLEVSPGVPGSDRTNFTITVTNYGPEGAATVVNDLLPAGMQIPAGESATVSTGSYDEATGVWTVGTLAATSPPTTETLEIPVEVISGNGCITNTATVSPAPGETVSDGNLDNNSASQLIAAGPECGADLGISGITDESITFADPGSPYRCLDVWVDVTVANHGPSTATGVKIVTNTRAFEDQVSWENCDSTYLANPMEPDEVELGSLAPGESITQTMLQIRELPAAGDDIDFKVDYSVQSETFDPDDGNNRWVLESTIQRSGDGGSGGYCFIGSALERP
jgi:uncharacterized repeat protein (TIGR01451 family)